jgi:protein phosphatase
MLTAYGATHPGRVRKINEDSWLSEPELGLFVVADGMGGHNAGEVASKLAIEAIRRFVARTSDGDDATWPYGIDPSLSFNANRLKTSVKLANRRVFKASESLDDYSGMGTTGVVVLIDQGRMNYASVGDSRIYSCQGGRLQQLTADDSWISEVLARDPGVDPASLRDHPMRNVLTSVIGVREALDVKVAERALSPGEIVMLCCDGLHGALPADAIQAILAGGGTPDALARRLVDAALEGPATDNITAVVVRYDP